MSYNYNSGIKVLFACRLCAHSFDQVSYFIAHKKENHFQEFQLTTCIVFEDKPNSSCSDDGYVEVEGSLPSSRLVKLETFKDASKNLKPEIKRERQPQSKGCLTMQPAFKVIPTKIKTTKDEITIFEPKSQPHYKNPVVLLKRISSKEISNFTEKHSYEEGDDEGASNISDLTEAPHSETEVDATTHVFTCKICHKNLSSGYQLRTHVQICLLYNNSKSNLTYCSECNNFFASTQQLEDHIQFTHVYKNVEDTSKPATTPALVSTRFKCPFLNCNRVFKVDNTLQSHIRTHTGERPFKCPVPNCGKAFTHIGTLYNHKTMTHSDVPLFKCPLSSCNHVFKAKRSVRRHFQTFHETLKRRKLGRPKKQKK